MRISGAAGTLVTIGLAAVLAGGCAHSGQRGGVSPGSSPLTLSAYPSSTGNRVRPAVPIPAPGSVQGADVTAVALAAVRAIKQSDTSLDADPNDTVKRASMWLTASFARQVRRYPPLAAPGAMWNQWAAHRAYVKVTTSLGGDDHPADSAAAAYRQVIAVLHPIGRDGWTGPGQIEVVFVSLAVEHGRWRLASSQAS